MANFKRTLFIDEKTLKDNSVLQNNVDMKLVTSSIQYIQDAVLQQILGSRLYRELQQQVFDNNIQADYKDLLDNYIEPFMIYGVLSEVPDSLLMKLMNQTIGSTTDDQMTSASLRHASYIKNQYSNKMKFYAKRLDDYLGFNTDKFPEFLEGIEDEIKPSRNPYTSQISMPSSMNSGSLKHKYNDITYDYQTKSWN